MALVAAATIALVALILAPGWLFYYDVTPKLITLLTGAGIGALLWRGRRPATAFSVLLGCTAVALAASTAAGAAVSGNAGLALFGSTWRRLGLLAQVALLALAWLIAAADHRDRRIVLRGIAWAAAISSVYGIAQYFGFDPILPAAGYRIGEGLWAIVRPPGTLGYVSYFATWLLMAGFLCLALAAREDSRPLRTAAYASAALCFAAMLLTGTRAALLGCPAGVAAALIRRGIRVPTRVLVAAAAVTVIAALFYFSPAGWPLRSRTRWFREDAWGGARPLLWRDSLRMAAAQPLFGFGPEVFTATFPHFESRELARAYPDFAHESPHNIFLDAWISQGLLGLASLLCLCALGIYWTWRSHSPWLLAALLAGLTAQQFTVFTLPTALLFYLTLALCSPAARPPSGRRFPVPKLVFAAIMLYCAFRFAAADRMLEITRQRLDAHDIPGAAAAFSRYRSLRFPGAAAELWYSRALLAQGAIIPAGQAAIAAATRPEDPFDAWYNLAEIYAFGNDAPQAETALRHAVAAHPNWFKPHWMLGRLLRLEGRNPEAAREAAQAADLDGGKDSEITRSLAALTSR